MKPPILQSFFSHLSYPAKDFSAAAVIPNAFEVKKVLCLKCIQIFPYSHLLYSELLMSVLQ